MVFQPPSMPFATNLGMGATSTITERYEIKSENIGARRSIIRSNGMRGKRSQVIERARQGTLTIGGMIELEPNYNELRKLLPRILGGTESAGSGLFNYAISDSLPAFWVQVDRMAKVWKYNNCAVDKAVFRSSAGQFLSLSLGIEALTEDVGNSGTFQSGLTINTSAPFVHSDATLTLAGAAVQMMDVQLTIDNSLKKDRFVNSVTRTDLPPEDRIVTLRCTVPWTSDTVALYETGAGGVTADLKYLIGGAADGSTGVGLHFVLGSIIFPANGSPNAGGKQDELTLVLEGQILSAAGADELAAILDVVA